MTALAEHGSFARAAVALHLSQPALSRSVQRFERHVGTSLFVRSGSGVVPTDFGRLLIQRARQIAELAADAIRLIGERVIPALSR